jgi:hypothetical protein
MKPDDDLRLSSRSPVAQADNGYFLLLTPTAVSAEAAQVLDTLPAHDPLALRAAIEAWPEGTRAAAVAAVSPLVTAFEAASARPAFQCPSAHGRFGSDVALCELGIILRSGAATILTAYQAYKEGDSTRGAQLVGSVLTFGRTLATQSEPGSYLEMIVGITLMEQATTLLSSGVNAPVGEVLRPLPLEALSPALARRYEDESRFVMAVLEKRPVSDFWFQPQRTRQEFADFVRLERDHRLTPCDRDLPPYPRRYLTLIEAPRFWSPVLPNAKGTLVLRETIGAYVTEPSVRDRVCALNQRLRQHLP